MAGHSQFKNIMHRKGAQDAKRAKIFTKIIREITVAVKEGGSEADSNPRLRGALASAREANMPKDNVDRAIKKALGGGEGTDYTSVRYEGYGPGGIALIVEALTDNRNRTAAEIRSAFNKYGGALGEPNSVSFQFDRLGVISFMAPVATPEVIFEAALEAGAEDVESDTTGHIVKTSLESFHRVRDQLVARFGEPNSSKVLWEPRNPVAISTDKAPSLLKLIDVLEDNDDVQEVSANFDLDEAAMKELQAN